MTHIHRAEPYTLLRACRHQPLVPLVHQLIILMLTISQVQCNSQIGNTTVNCGDTPCMCVDSMHGTLTFLNFLRSCHRLPPRNLNRNISASPLTCFNSLLTWIDADRHE